MDAVKIGKAIQFLRKRIGYTQKQLAERLSVSDKAVSKWERGIGIPDISFLRKLSTILDADIDSLLQGDVVSNESMWIGLLYLNGDFAASLVYDKPLSMYLIGYFMLAKVRNIVVFCNETVMNAMQHVLSDGSGLGIHISYCLNDGKADECIRTHRELFLSRKILVIYANELLYGVDLSRFFYRGMINDGKTTILAIPKNSDNRKIFIDEERRIAPNDEKENVHLHYSYCALPILYVPGGMSFLDQYSFSSFDELILKMARDGVLYAELMDKGFVDIEITDYRLLNDASDFIRSVQNATGYTVGDLAEIAYRRAFISSDELRNIADSCGQERAEYLHRLL